MSQVFVRLIIICLLMSDKGVPDRHKLPWVGLTFCASAGDPPSLYISSEMSERLNIVFFRLS
jgi:hypothetical protein